MSVRGPPLAAVVPGAVTALTLLVAFGLLALDVDAFWVAFPVGFGGVLPAALAAAARVDARSTDAAEDATDEALADLRTRYARGDLSEAEFEREVEALLAESRPTSERASEHGRVTG